MGKTKPLPDGVDKNVLQKIAALHAMYPGRYLMQCLYNLAFSEDQGPCIADIKMNAALCADLQAHNIMDDNNDITDPNVRAVLKAAVYESDQPSADPKNPFVYPSLRIQPWCHGYLGAAAKKLQPARATSVRSRTSK